jgi:hypothetical protein
MPNFLYAKAKEKFLNGQLSWGVGTGGDTFKAMLLSEDYVFDKVNHTTLANVPTSARLGTSSALTNKNVTSGVASANPVTFTNLPLSKSIKAILIIKQNAGATDSQTDLIAYIDTATGLTTGLPITVSTATIEWGNDTSNPPQKRLIFELAVPF